MSFRAKNAISGKEGRLFLDGEEVAHAKSFEATITKNKTPVNILGRKMEGHKTTGASGEGTLVLYKVTSRFVQIMSDYVNGGPDEYFVFQSVLDDKGSGRGVERVTLLDVNLDSVKVAGLNVDEEVLEEEVPFTFEGIDAPETLSDTF